MRFEAEAGGRSVRVTVRGEPGRYEVTLGDQTVQVDAQATGPHALSLLIAGRSHEIAFQRRDGGFLVRVDGIPVDVQIADASLGGGTRSGGGSSRITAPMPGKVVRLMVAAGDTVDTGAGLVVVEAMKMENELRATRAGRVRAVHVREGQPVEGGALLIELE